MHDTRAARGLLALLLLFLMTAPTFGAEPATHQWWKISFQTPIGFSAPQKVGLDAAAMLHPPESGLGKGLMEITLVEVPKDMQASFGNQDAEIINYVKTTFLGATAPAAKAVERTFLGKKVVGAAQATTIPRPGELEIYLIPLTGGDKAALAFSRQTTFPKEKADAVITMVAQTLKEIKSQ